MSQYRGFGQYYGPWSGLHLFTVIFQAAISPHFDAVDQVFCGPRGDAEPRHAPTEGDDQLNMDVCERSSRTYRAVLVSLQSNEVKHQFNVTCVGKLKVLASQSAETFYDRKGRISDSQPDASETGPVTQRHKIPSLSTTQQNSIRPTQVSSNSKGFDAMLCASAAISELLGNMALSIDPCSQDRCRDVAQSGCRRGSPWSAHEESIRPGKAPLYLLFDRPRAATSDRSYVRGAPSRDVPIQYSCIPGFSLPPPRAEASPVEFTRILRLGTLVSEDASHGRLHRVVALGHNWPE
ncbi:hypothetical protein OH76DRAFT_1418820 [Lentinus brumalis]|uniref:Uncharacterized protein n=1 Tax=Lentinus brumalis TaxID=2498619 RepID=A0A371D8J3_9APHY|nr:hypothetical protein OH76DRAFT_1418820 [Polyporus brumalis]